MQKVIWIVMARLDRMGANFGKIGLPAPIPSWWPKGRHPCLTSVSAPSGVGWRAFARHDAERSVPPQVSAYAA
jgi:hypothetical protein